MRRAYILLLIFFLGFGCIDDKVYPSDRSEQVLSSELNDYDGDGINDYSIYTFNPITKSDAGIKIQRQVMVTTYTGGSYTSINPNLTDVDLLLADQSLDEFSKSRFQSDSACSKNIGLLNVVCSDVTTCTRLCSTASVSCKEMSRSYEDVLAGSMISYVQDNNEIRSLVLDSRRMVLSLRNTTDEERNIFLGKTRDMVAKVADINSNPLYVQPKVQLCDHSDFGIGYVVDATQRIGTYETFVESYQYRILFAIDPLEKNDGELGVEVAGVGVSDSIPTTVISDAKQISSIQDILAENGVSYVKVKWISPKTSDDGYLLEYEFISTTPPETLLASLRTPDVTIKTVDMSGLIPTNIVFTTLDGIIKNYYMALGIALGLGIAFVLFLYNVVTLLITIISERTAGATITTGFRKAFGRTEVRWKTDGAVAVLFLVAGFYVSAFVAVQPTVSPGLLESVDFLIKSNFGIVGLALTLIGVVMIYFACENMAKITILEKAYGMAIREEKGSYLEKAGKLKEKMKELELLVEKYTQEEFDVGKEYDVLTAMKGQDMDKLTNNITPRSKAIIDDRMNAIEGAITNLKERKKLADENWLKWKENISKILEEQNEVFASSLVTVPSSLRAWALNRYFRELGGDGITLEHDGLKKRKLSANKIVHEMVLKGILKAGIVIRNDSIETSEFAEGSGTVTKALILKLRAYMRSLAKKLGQHEPQSFISIGAKDVVVYMKGRTTESVIIVKRDKFNQAVEMWKSKIKLIEAA
ncbi:hypothetical protein KKE92_00045 [Candidatus Micrarchaeota archaeon]|nr:hypothetical protein [Candidatus Micrarchaeota archaeon]MBU1681962.1 hypothetical protein [Candidatus Micrarchaeota archaeon]